MADLKSIQDIPLIELGSSGLAGAVPQLVDGYEGGGRVFRTRYIGGDLVFLVGPDANRFVLTSGRENFSHHQGWGLVFGDPPNILTQDGEEHDDHRHAAGPAFSAKRMDSYMELIDRQIRERIDAWADESEVDVYEEMRLLTFDLSAQAFLGMNHGAEVDTMRDAYLVDRGHQRPDDRRRGEELILSKIGERRQRPTDDALGLLVQHRNPDGRPISDAQLISHAGIMLLAGYETSASLGAWALYLLAVHRDVARRVGAEVARVRLGDPPAYARLRELVEIDLLLTEAERLYPPVPYGPRGMAADTEFDGYLLPAGTMVVYCIAASHLLPSLWSSPGAFDPDRFAAPREEQKQHPYALVGFGGGPRRCIGMTFARAELMTVVARVIDRYHLDLVPGHSVVQMYGITAHPLGGMRLRTIERVSVG
ncbi:MAG TPA: cytochrome P450 [Candidatus Saccharimonadales bacterium]|nr:cytochrome P450 [Candidatus Saccharimonadales bacterium]